MGWGSFDYAWFVLTNDAPPYYWYDKLARVAVWALVVGVPLWFGYPLVLRLIHWVRFGSSRS